MLIQPDSLNLIFVAVKVKHKIKGKVYVLLTCPCFLYVFEELVNNS